MNLKFIKRSALALVAFAAANPAKVNELASKPGKYLRSVHAMRPSFKKSGQLAPWPDQIFNK